MKKGRMRLPLVSTVRFGAASTLGVRFGAVCLHEAVTTETVP